MGSGRGPESIRHSQRRRAGSGGWGGIFNTHFWIDPPSVIAGCLFMQFLPYFDPAAIRLYNEFEAAVYANVRRTSGSLT
jgi:methyl acetate hydrolase